MVVMAQRKRHGELRPKKTLTTSQVLQQKDDPAWRRSAGNALNAVLGGMSAANNADPSGHSAANAPLIEVPRPHSPPQARGNPQLDPRLQLAVDQYISEGISAGLANIGPAVEAAVAKALAKAGGSDE